MKITLRKIFTTITYLSLIIGTAAWSKTYEIKVDEKGFTPSTIRVQNKERVVLSFTRVTDNTCALAVQIPDLKLKKDLPLDKKVNIELGRVIAKKIQFGCTMGMMFSGSVLLVP